MTGVRHSDDDVKKKVIDCVFKLGQLNNIPENMLKRIRIVRVRPWGVCTGVISTVGVLYQIGQLSLIFLLCDWKGNDYCQYSGGVVLDSEAFSRRFCGCRLYS